MNSGGLRGCPLSTNPNAGAGDKTSNYVLHPPLFIAFVSARFSFLRSSQIYHKFWFDKKIHWKSFREFLSKLSSNSGKPKSPADFVKRKFRVESVKPSQSKFSRSKFLSVRMNFQWTKKCLNKLIFCRLPWFINLALTVTLWQVRE